MADGLFQTLADGMASFNKFIDSNKDEIDKWAGYIRNIASFASDFIGSIVSAIAFAAG